MAGPEEQRLIRALSGAAPEALDVHRDEWNMCAGLLVAVARQLQATELPIPDGDAGGLTASAMNAAFATAATAMTARSLQLREGRNALGTVASALQRAHLAYAGLGPERSAPTYTPHADPQSEEGIKVHNAYLGQLAAFQADQQHREEVARQQNEQLDAAFTSAQRTMQEIHGEKRHDTTPPAYSGATVGGGGGSTSGSGAPMVATSAGTSTGAGSTHTFPGHSHAGHHAEIVPGGDHVHYTPGGAGDLSSPGEPGELPAAMVVGANAEPGAGGLGLGAGAGVAGGAAAGIIGARLGGVLKGGGLFGGGQGVAGATARAGVAARGSTAATVRGIGTSSRSGTSGTLGRSGAAGSSGRSGAGAGAAGRAGAGATGRGGRGKDDRKRRPTEAFDVGEDWVGDDDAAPGVLD